ncbi:hypothetical protein HID58_095143 [Brassica napus]|uniref:Uncharacterized protein n=1 Tax=Brassica napus TaxID=3708 RepID=A0ABQ7X4T2_BRANA|nr:hypothetical protein HID58_095143 [Brassica napus]
MKPNGKSPLIKHTDKTNVSSTKAVSGDPTLKKTKRQGGSPTPTPPPKLVSPPPNLSPAILYKETNGKAVVSSPRADEVVLKDTETKLAE